jgi:hypothetical protein
VIQVHDGTRPEDVRRWVLSGDGVIGEVTCTHSQALAMAAGPELLAALQRVREHWNGKPNYGDGFHVEDVVTAAILKAEGRAG